MVKVWFPNMFMKLISVTARKNTSTAVLHVAPSMTKTEVKEYLTKIYNVPVLNVVTANLLGKWKRLYGKRKVISYKRRNIKRVEVEFKTKDATASIP